MYDYSINNACIVHNTPLLSFNKDSNEIIQEIPGIKNIFFHHGYLTKEKDITDLIVLFSKLTKVNNKIKLIIAGSGDCVSGYKKLVSDMRSSNNIEFTGEYDYCTLPELIKNAGWGIIPYPPNEFNNYTIHNKIFDYFAFGKPVIVSTAVPLARLINETGAGFVANFQKHNEAMKTITKSLKTDYADLSYKSINAFKNKYNWEVDEANLVCFIRKYI